MHTIEQLDIRCIRLVYLCLQRIDVEYSCRYDKKSERKTYVQIDHCHDSANSHFLKVNHRASEEEMEVEKEILGDDGCGLVTIEAGGVSRKDEHQLYRRIFEDIVLCIGQHPSDDQTKNVEVDKVFGQVPILVAKYVQQTLHNSQDPD